MNVSAERALEFNKIREALASWAQTDPGRAKCLALRPEAEVERARRALEETGEAKRLAENGERLSLSGLPEIDGEIDELAVAGRALTVPGFARLARFAGIATGTRKQLTRQEDEAPRLAGRAAALPMLDGLDRDIRRTIDVETEEVKDDASQELARIRAEARRLGVKLQKLLDGTLASRDNAKLLQESLVTTRNNRPVVPVRAECKSQFPGIVHGASASGATVFIEPMATVPLSNELAVLRDREAEEIRRILHTLTEGARVYRDALAEAVEILAELDLAQAKARLSDAYAGQPPTLTDARELRLQEARHPLLVPEVAERAGLPPRSTEPVPISLGLSPERRGLVLTGPNTGGKTVALKTVGLLALMAQSGLHIPASSTSVLPVFRSVFADIGDDQSIGASLSTFSSHLAKVVEMERGLESPALIILDEVGTGTDPSEGGALGTALLEHFLARGALVFASTHHGLLKAYALTTPGVAAASFEFDPKSYAPTYRIVEGAAGRSLAFEMSERLGLPPDIVRRARQLQGEREKQVGELVQRLEADTAELERERQRLENERRSTREARARVEAEEDEARRERGRRLARLRESLEEELAETRRELKALVTEARQALSEVRASGKESRERLAKLDRDLTARLEAVVAPLAEKVRRESPESAREAPAPPLAPGARVLVASFGVEGEVLRIHDEEAEVLVHDKKLRLPIASLEALEADTSSPRAEPPRGTTRGPEPKSLPSELNLVGKTVAEALGEADKFLDDAVLSEYRQVRLIHGHGTGRLRNALREWLSEHPHVARHVSESRDGATVVELKE